MEEWSYIPEFQAYSVSDMGRVRNDDTGRLLAIKRNNLGTCFVGLSKNGRQHQRGLSLLVATAFLPKMEKRENFVHPIHTDGDQTNNNVRNLLWRPRWFAMEYAKQFKHPIGENSLPVLELQTQERYITAWDASIAFGLLASDLIYAIANRTIVWPTFQEFRFIEE